MIKFKGTRKELAALVNSTFTKKAQAKLVYEVTLTIGEPVPTETPHEKAIRLARPLAESGQKIAAIKLYREHTTADLVTAKNAIEKAFPC